MKSPAEPPPRTEKYALAARLIGELEGAAMVLRMAIDAEREADSLTARVAALRRELSGFEGERDEQRAGLEAERAAAEQALAEVCAEQEAVRREIETLSAELAEARRVIAEAAAVKARVAALA